MNGQLMYQLKKLGVLDTGQGRWHVTVTDEPGDEVEQQKLHNELLEEFHLLIPRLTMAQMRESLANGVAVLPAWRAGNELQVWCSHCQQWHFHERGDGPRVADCTCSDSPYRDRGYVICEVGDFADVADRAKESWTGQGCATCDRAAQ